MSTSIEDRLARLEAIEEIKQLKAHYCALCDDNYVPDGLAALFVPDAIWDGGQFTVHDGTSARLVDSVHLYEKKK